MGQALVYSIVESPGHPNLSALYRRLGIEELRLASQRKAVQALKSRPPDWVWPNSSTVSATITRAPT